MDITYDTRTQISPRRVQNLFRRLEWSDWWTQKDIAWYLSHALFVVSAWDGRRLVGMGVLSGDGRINVHLDMLIVDQDYQRNGIGTGMVDRMVKHVDELRPYHFGTDVFSEDAERLYERFGFSRNKETWLLYHDPTYQKWGPAAMRQRKARQKRRRNG